MRDLVQTLAQRMRHASRPLVVALDGRSGSGKSTLAVELARRFSSAVVPADDFFAATIPDPEWDARTTAQRVADALNWTRLRSEALEPLRAGRSAHWHAFDFVAGLQADGTYPMQAQATTVAAAPLIVLEGAYSTRAELQDLLDITVLVEIPDAIRRRRLAGREDPTWLEQWHKRWDPAEDLYFGQLRPATAFDFRTDGQIARVDPGSAFHAG